MTLMETAQLLGNVGEFVGSIAVVATLAYLAIQVRDAGRAATLAAVGSHRAARREWFISVRESQYMPDIYRKLGAGETLEPDEGIRLMSHNAAEWGLLYSEWVERDLGLMGEFTTSDEMALRSLLGSPSAMDFWNGVGSRIFPARFIEYVKQAANTGAAEVN
jgi:hypothetical protein